MSRTMAPPPPPPRRRDRTRTAVAVAVLACVAALTSLHVAEANFPGAWSNCPTRPRLTPTALDPTKPLPPSLAQALQAADSAASLSQQRLGDPALSVGVVYNQTLIFSKGYGLRNASDPSSAKPDGDTIYRIGSISKIFATLQMLQMRDEGKLDLDDPVAKHVPEFRVRPPVWQPYGPGAPPTGAAGNITFRQLATHLAGLPREPPCSALESCAMNNSVAWQRLSTMTAISPTDYRPSYSNLGFAALGAALATVDQDKYEDMTHRRIIAPLGLANTGVNITRADRTHVAWPYYNKDDACGEACLQDFGWANPCGSMYSTVNDLAEIIKLQFRDMVPAAPARRGLPKSATPTGAQILSGPTIREMAKINYLDRDRNGGFALTWELYDVGDYMVRTKRGDVDGYASEIVFVPELKLGVVVLANVMEGAQDAAQRMTNILLPAFDTYMRAAAPNGRAPPSPVDLPPYPAAFEGTYGTKDQGSFTVSLSSGGDALVMSGMDVALQYLPQASAAVMMHDGERRDGSPAYEYVFRTVPQPGSSDSCWDRDTGDDYQLFVFQGTAPGASMTVSSFTADIMYGITFERQSSK